VSVGPEPDKSLRRKVKTGSGNAERTSVVLVIIPYAIDYKDGGRGRNRTFNLLIKTPNREDYPEEDKGLGSANSSKVLQNPQPRRNKRRDE
jgi:hypothetical protein